MMILQEVKKIFEKKRVFLILILGILFCILFFQQNIGIPAYSSDSVNIGVSKMLQKKYGNEIDRGEYLDLLNDSSFTEESDVDAWIRENKDFGQYGIASYGDLLEKQDSLSDQVAGSLISQITERFTEEEQQEALDNIWRNEYMESLIRAYDMEITSKPSTTYYTELSEDSRKRIAERNREEVYSIMPDSVMRDYLSIFPDFAIFLLLSVILLIVPYSVKDTMECVNVLQYVSQKGKKFYWEKMIAVFLSAVILCVIETGLFLIMLRENNAFCFADCFVSGFRNPFITFMKLTFGEYIALGMAYIDIVALCLSVITYCLSSCAHNYISAVAFQIPLVIFSVGISLMFLPHFAEITQNVKLLFLIPVFCFLLAGISNVIRFITIKFYEKI